MFAIWISTVKQCYLNSELLKSLWVRFSDVIQKLARLLNGSTSHVKSTHLKSSLLKVQFSRSIQIMEVPAVLYYIKTGLVSLLRLFVTQIMSWI